MASSVITTPKAKKRSTSRLLKSEGIYSYGELNDYPQRMASLISASGTASRCVNRYARFIAGRGLSNPSLYKLPIDRNGTTLDKLLNLLALDFAKFNGFAVHVRYNGLGQIIERKHLPFQDTRLATDGSIAYYDNWDATSLIKRYNKADIVYMQRFDPSKVIQEINKEKHNSYSERVANYPGQILWYSIEGHSAYPLAPCDPVAEDVETDYQAKLYKNKNIRTSFTASGIYVAKGKSESSTDREANQLALTDFQGSESAGNIMYVEVDSEDEKPDFIPFNPSQTNDTRFKFHEESVELSIVKCYLIPPVLAGVLVAGKLGTSNELEDAYNVYNSETEPIRNIFEEQISLLVQQPVTILPLQFKALQNGTTA